jgi:hypothetical protein
MEPSEEMESHVQEPAADVSSRLTPPMTAESTLSLQGELGACPACGCAGAAGQGTAITPSYVYAIGRIEPRFPKISVEKEFSQATSRAQTAGLSDRQALQRVLSKSENRYLARQLCWVMTIEGLETYIIYPRDPSDFTLLVEAIRPTPSPLDLDVIVGMRGEIAPPELCNGLTVPIVRFDQLYWFDRDSLIKAIPRPEKTAAKEFAAAAEELFDRIQQIADNAGATDEHRALNYLSVRYPAIYATAAEAHGRNCTLAAVDVLSSRLTGVRKVVDVVFSYLNRTTDVSEKFFVRVDVTDEFPFLVTKLQPYYDR